ncbi:MAG: hypothetical protein ACT443_15400 [Gemmatimonadota bacterium]
MRASSSTASEAPSLGAKARHSDGPRVVTDHVLHETNSRTVNPAPAEAGSPIVWSCVALCMEAFSAAIFGRTFQAQISNR